MLDDPSDSRLDPLHVLDADFAARPAPTLERLRRTCPVAKVRTPAGAEVWLVTRECDVRASLLDSRIVPAGTPTRPKPGARALQVSLLNYAPADHARLRRLATSCFTPSRVQAHRPVIEAIAQDLAGRLAGERHTDLLADFAYPFAGRTVCELFGVAQADRGRFCASSIVLVAKPPHSGEKRREATRVFEDVIESEVSSRIHQVGNRSGILSSIVTAWRDTREQVSREELLSLCGMLLQAGFETTAQMLCLAMVAILTHPPILDRLRRSPDTAPGMLDELLRWDAPGPFVRRWAQADIEIGGTAIPAGSTVLLSIMAANRDPDDRPDPGSLDPDRAEGGRHLAFGLGPHYCMGAPLARLMLEIALATLLGRHPDMALAVPADDLPWQGTHLNRGLSALPVLISTSSE